MNSILTDFGTLVRSNPSYALKALLQIAETKEAILQWERETVSSSNQIDLDDDPKCSAITLALSYVDRAEEAILDAFYLDRQAKEELF